MSHSTRAFFISACFSVYCIYSCCVTEGRIHSTVTAAFTLFYLLPQRDGKLLYVALVAYIVYSCATHIFTIPKMGKKRAEWMNKKKMKQRISHQPPRHDHSVCNIERVLQSESSRMWNNSIVTSRIYLHYTFIFFSRHSVLCISHSFFCVRCCLKTIFLTISISNIYTINTCMYFNDFNDFNDKNIYIY